LLKNKPLLFRIAEEEFDYLYSPYDFGICLSLAVISGICSIRYADTCGQGEFYDFHADGCNPEFNPTTEPEFTKAW
jgi:hypothetical protein